MALLIYLPGLRGELLFDDAPNLVSVQQWQQDKIGWRAAVFGNESGPLGRPVSMMSFAANAAMTGGSVAGFKTGNLVLHLLTAALVFLLLATMARRDRVIGPHAQIAALAVTAVWLLHPMMVGTVLYVVQRMAMLSALFTLAALLAFWHGRLRLERGGSDQGIALLFGAVPFFTMMAALSKENGLLAPLLCLVLEWVYFRPAPNRPRPRPVRIFVVVFGVLPVIAGCAALLLAPDWLLSGYENRPFTLAERLMTQSRVLFDYVGALLLPAGAQLSLFRDDYPVSTGLLTPPGTLAAIGGWAGIVVAAVMLRRKIPGFSAGIGVFLAGHAMESTIFPLLIYFEHRNYLPGLGIFWAAASLLVWTGNRLSSRVTRPRLLFLGATVALLVVLAAATHARARIWQSNELLLRQSLQHYPDSRHMRMSLAEVEMNRPIPRLAEAQRHYRHLTGLEQASTRMIGYAGLVVSACHATGRFDEDTLARVFAETPRAIEADLLKALQALGRAAIGQRCQGLSSAAVAAGIAGVLQRADIPRRHRPVWQLHFEAAKLYNVAELPTSALQHAQTAWQAGDDLNVGVMVAGLLVQAGRHREALELIKQLDSRLPADDHQAHDLLRSYRQALPPVAIE